MQYNKLVRDRIPQIIRKAGGKPVIRIANETEYWQKLKEKFLEEVREFIETEDKKELADVLELIEAVCRYKKFNTKQLTALKKGKARERGRFHKKIILVES